jgi:hypothetical protein
LKKVINRNGNSTPRTARGSSNMNGRVKVDLRQQKNGKVYAEGLTRVAVSSSDDVQSVMAIGAKSRSVGAHDFNAHSSRSHLVITVTIIAEPTKSDSSVEDDLSSKQQEAWGAPPPSSSPKQRLVVPLLL